MKAKGKFIVLYGANNLGKSVQIRELTKKMLEHKHEVLTIKYPMYKLEPTGPRINGILRDPKHPERGIDELEFQKIYAQNRRDFQETLESLLDAHINVVAEDYVGTSIAWGHTKGAELPDLISINSDLRKPDLEILLDGERFSDGIEKGHRNEDTENIIWKKNRKIHLDLADQFQWSRVNANDTIENVHANIWKLVNPILV